uniref:T-cell surface glycoprotein CD3 delta chain-like n=1 Tax=Cyprinodon variegatus TaxID=28743 RepID=A0A3Q2D4T9_CYPVA
MKCFSFSYTENSIEVKDIADGVVLKCGEKMMDRNGQEADELTLYYRDDQSGEYECTDKSKIYVKFRTCDNCVELDIPSIAGLTVGDVVATIVVGVAVYLIATQGRRGQVKPPKKKSDRQNLNHNNDDNYQPLIHTKGGRSEYDELRKEKGGPR